MNIFCKRVKELREENNLTQKELAVKLAVTNSTVCDWEKGRSQPDLEMLAKIACFFEVKTDYLLGLED
jgi:transcriptional regulator with XRE-family HTH domain